MSNYEGIFDKALRIIDENIKQKYDDIKRILYAKTGYCSQDYNKFMAITTSGELTLLKYYNKRRAYFASCEIKNNSKTLSVIAVEFNYSEQSALNRAIKEEFNTTPMEIRKNGRAVPDNRFNTTEAINNTKNRLTAVIEKLKKDERYDIDNPKPAVFSSYDEYLKMIAKWDCAFVNDRNYFEAFLKATDEYGFDIDTCCLISELSEKLMMPFSFLLNKMFNTLIEYKEMEDYPPEQIEYAIDLGIYTDIELHNICEYYGLKYYELTRKMVKKYKDEFGDITDYNYWRSAPTEFHGDIVRLDPKE